MRAQLLFTPPFHLLLTLIFSYLVIGLSYEHAIDVWSAACTLYELFTGKILFPGRSNNQMLKHIMEVKGKFPNRLIRKGAFGAQHFDEDNNFISAEVDRISKKVSSRETN